MMAASTKLQAEWTVVVNPGPDGKPQDAPPPPLGARNAPAAGGRPAMKGQAGVRQR